jgi:hypothetical protein
MALAMTQLVESCCVLLTCSVQVIGGQGGSVHWTGYPLPVLLREIANALSCLQLGSIVQGVSQRCDDVGSGGSAAHALQRYALLQPN